MTSFLDGPAKGQHLTLARAPYFLRVVRAGKKWDALDQFADEPSPGEEIFAYSLVGDPGMVHMDFRNPRRGVWFTIANYMLVSAQPPDAEMRDNALWREWCYAHAPKEWSQR